MKYKGEVIKGWAAVYPHAGPKQPPTVPWIDWGDLLILALGEERGEVQRSVEDGPKVIPVTITIKPRATAKGGNSRG